jgi:hypothetical protein
LPEDVLQEILVNAQMLNEAAEQVALPHGEMPGGLPGENFVQLEFVGEADVEGEDPTVGGAREGTPVGDEVPLMLTEDEEDEEEDEDIEEVSIILSPCYLLILNHVRLHRCLFVCCVIWSAVSGVVPMLMRTARQKTDHKERLSWMAWTRK